MLRPDTDECSIAGPHGSLAVPACDTAYEGLPARLCAEGLDPAVPWLYGYKLHFRFR